MTYDAQRDLIKEALFFAKDKTLGKRAISLIERLTAALEKELEDNA